MAPNATPSAEATTQEDGFVRERRGQAIGWLFKWLALLTAGYILYHNLTLVRDLFSYGHAKWVVGLAVVAQTGWFGYRVWRPNLMLLRYGHGATAFGFVGLLVLLVALVSWLYFAQVLPRVLGETPSTVGTHPAADTEAAMKRIGDYLQALALLAAGLFFVYKLYTGWLIINLSVGISTTRHPLDKTKNKELLIVSLSLDKGTNDTLWLTKIEYKVELLGTGGAPAPPFEPLPLPIWSAGSGEEVMPEPHQRYQAQEAGLADWSVSPDRGITLAPGEKYAYAKAFVVPSGWVCQVEVVVLGKRPLFGERGLGQWRAVAIAPPLVPEKTA